MIVKMWCHSAVWLVDTSKRYPRSMLRPLGTPAGFYMGLGNLGNMGGLRSTVFYRGLKSLRNLC